MARTSRVRKQPEQQAQKAERHELKSLPHADKLLAFAEEAPSAKPRARTRKKVPEPTPQTPPAKRFSAADAAREAGEQVEALVRMKVDSISAVTRSENGWDVVVNVIELARIPHSTDVLASYNVCLDCDGGLVSYSRSTRYTRGQTGEVL